MNYKSVILFLCSIMGIAILYNIPTYNSWMHRKIFTISNITEQMEHMDFEERRESRYGYSYMVFKDMGKKMKEENGVVLLPPDSYLAANKIEVKMVEPSLFYYFTGMTAVNVNSPKVWMANWALVAEGQGRMAILKLRGRKHADSLISFLKKYPQP